MNEKIWLYNENCVLAGKVCQDENLIECESGDIHAVEGTREELIEWARELDASRTDMYNRRCAWSVLEWLGDCDCVENGGTY